MAELILTEQEKAVASYLDWDDSALANAVRVMAMSFNDAVAKESLTQAAIASYLVNQNIKMNAKIVKLKLEGVSQGDDRFGDFEITIRKLD